MDKQKITVITIIISIIIILSIFTVFKLKNNTSASSNFVGNAIAVASADKIYEIVLNPYKSNSYKSCTGAATSLDVNFITEKQTIQAVSNANRKTAFSSKCMQDVLNYYYCSNNHVYFAKVKCLNGCEKNACKQPSPTEQPASAPEPTPQAPQCTPSEKIQCNNEGTGNMYKITISQDCSQQSVVTEYCTNGCDANGCKPKIVVAAAKPSCTETDNGNDIYTKGTTSYDGYTGVDYCAPNGAQLQEFYCENGDYKNTIVYCNNGCKEGACLPETPAPVQAAPQKECTTSNDCPANKFCYTDEWRCLDCSVVDVKTTTYCDGTAVKRKTYSLHPERCTAVEKIETVVQCGYGCKDAACLSEADATVVNTCTDTDSGIDFTKKGIVTTNGATGTFTFTDYCNGSPMTAGPNKGKSYLVEYSCENTDKKQTETLCNCIDGASV